LTFYNDNFVIIIIVVIIINLSLAIFTRWRYSTVLRGFFVPVVWILAKFGSRKFKGR